MKLAKNILSVDDLSNGDVSRLFFEARSLKGSRLSDFSSLQEKCLLNVFLEPSTRTKLSFERAAMRLNMRSICFDEQTSALKKGESIKDTLLTLDALEPDVMVIRQKPLLTKDLIENVKAKIISGGDGCNEHPTQALLDCFTLTEHFKSDDLSGKKILIVGDIAHSRVANSNIKLLKRLGAKVFALAPSQFLPKDSSLFDACLENFSDVGKDLDVIMALRVQKERLEENLRWDLNDYVARFQVSDQIMEQFKNAVFMHPGPMNLGIETIENVASAKNSLVLRQVTNGVYVRAALIKMILEN